MLENLAVVLYAQGRFGESADRQIKALELFKTLHNGADHPDVAVAQGYLAGIVRVVGDADESMQLHRGSQEMVQRLRYHAGTRSVVDDDFVGFVKQHVCAPLAAACVGGAVQLQLHTLPADAPEALASDASIDALLRGVRDQLSDASSWSVREPRRQDTTVVVARASAAVPTVVKAAATAAGLPFRELFALGDAVAECTTVRRAHQGTAPRPPAVVAAH